MGNNKIIKVNPKVYPIEAVYSAAYVFLDKAYIVLDGDPEKEILVSIEPKDSSADVDEMSKEFYNELINYGDYIKRAADTKELREILIQRALITNNPAILADDIFDDDLSDEGIDLYENKEDKDEKKDCPE